MSSRSRSGSSRRKPLVTRKVFDNSSGDDDDDAGNAGKKVNGDSQSEEDILDELPEGTVVVKPEAVEEKNPTFKGPEFVSGKRKSTGNASVDVSGLMSRVTCSACHKQINTNKKGSARRHPLLKVLICKRCRTYYDSGPIQKDKDGLDEQCRWCGEGGRLFGCDFCHNAFCRSCIIHNLGRSELMRVQNDDKWKCYVCNSKSLRPQRHECEAVLEQIKKEEQKAKNALEREKEREKNKKDTPSSKNTPSSKSSDTVKNTPSSKSSDTVKTTPSSKSSDNVKNTPSSKASDLIRNALSSKFSDIKQSSVKSTVGKAAPGINPNVQVVVVGPKAPIPIQPKPLGPAQQQLKNLLSLPAPQRNVQQQQPVTQRIRQQLPISSPMMSRVGFVSSLDPSTITLPMLIEHFKKNVTPATIPQVLSKLMSITNSLTLLMSSIKMNIMDTPYNSPGYESINAMSMQSRKTAVDCLVSGLELFLQELQITTVGEYVPPPQNISDSKGANGSTADVDDDSEPEVVEIDTPVKKPSQLKMTMINNEIIVESDSEDEVIPVNMDVSLKDDEGKENDEEKTKNVDEEVEDKMSNDVDVEMENKTTEDKSSKDVDEEIKDKLSENGDQDIEDKSSKKVDKEKLDKSSKNGDEKLDKKSKNGDKEKLDKKSKDGDKETLDKKSKDGDKEKLDKKSKDGDKEKSEKKSKNADKEKLDKKSKEETPKKRVNADKESPKKAKKSNDEKEENGKVDSENTEAQLELLKELADELIKNGNKSDSESDADIAECVDEDDDSNGPNMEDGDEDDHKTENGANEMDEDDNSKIDSSTGVKGNDNDKETGVEDEEDKKESDDEDDDNSKKTIQEEDNQNKPVSSASDDSDSDSEESDESGPRRRLRKRKSKKEDEKPEKKGKGSLKIRLKLSVKSKSQQKEEKKSERRSSRSKTAEESQASDDEDNKSKGKKDKKKSVESESENFDSDLEDEIDKLAKNPKVQKKKKKNMKSEEEEEEEVVKSKKGKKKEIKEEKDKKSKGKKEEEEEKVDSDSSEGTDKYDPEEAVEEEEEEDEPMDTENPPSDLSNKENSSTEEDNDEDSDDSSDSEVVINSPKKKKGGKGASKKAKKSDSDSDSDAVPKKKTRLRTKLLDAKLSDSDDSDFQISKKGKGKKRKAKTDSSEDQESTEEDSDAPAKKKGRGKKSALAKQKERGKKGKRAKRRRIKVASESSDNEKMSTEGEEEMKNEKKKKKKKKKGSDSDDDDSDDEEGDEDGSPSKGRKKIRKIKSDKKLTDSTRKAVKAEEARRKRIAKKQKEFNNVLTEDDPSSPTKCPITKKLVLEYDKETKEPLIECDKRLITKLKPHQVEAAQFMWDCTIESVSRLKKEKGAGCILAHCMGLGKTLSVITFLHTVMNHSELTGITKALVVGPLNTVLNWQQEFETWLSGDLGEDFYEVFEISSVKQNVARADMLKHWHKHGGVMIMGYEMFRNLTQGNHCKSKKLKQIFRETLVDPGPDICVCDEGHILKNDASAISKAMNQLVTLRRIVLTGTPLQNNLVEYHCMVNFVKPNLLGTRKEFCNRFVNPIVNGQCTDSSSHDVRLMKRRAHIIHEKLAGCVQRKDYSALTKFLSPKYEYVISVRLSKVQIELYQKYLDRAGNANIMGKGAKLFSDYQALMRIWTHPWVLKMDEVRQEKKARWDDEDSFVEDGSLSEDESGSDTAKSSSSDSDVVAISDNSEDEEDDGTKKMRSTNEAGSSKDTDEVVVNSKGEVVKKWTTRSRGGDGTEWEGIIKAAEEEQEDRPLTTDWWADYVKEEDAHRLELSGKLSLLFEILRMSEEIGDKVLVFSQSLLSLDLIEDFLEHIDKKNQEEAEEKEKKKKEEEEEKNKESKEDENKDKEGEKKEEEGKEKSEEDKDKDEKDKDKDEKDKDKDEKDKDKDEKDKDKEKDEEANPEESVFGKQWTKGADYLRMDGSTSAQHRKELAASFNDPENYRARLFIISTKAGGLGINLVAANRVIIFDASWNPSNDVQSVFRVYRFGQTKPVYIYRFLAQGTMEEKIYERQVTKQSLSQRVVDEHQIERHFTSNDLQVLYNFKPDRLDDPNREEKPTPELPKDHMLAEMLQSHKEWICCYHKHDSLLENQLGEELTEEERQAAWKEFEDEKKGIANNVRQQFMGMNNMPGMPAGLNPNINMNMLMQQGLRMPQMGGMPGSNMPFNQQNLLQLVQDMKTRFPHLPEDQLTARVQGVIRHIITSQYMQQQEMQKRQLEQREMQHQQQLHQIQAQIQRQQQQLNAHQRMGGQPGNQPNRR